MPAPAARNALNGIMPRRGHVASHPGLLLQRYLRHSATGETGDPNEKQDILNAAISAAQNPQATQLYTKAYERWKNSLPDVKVCDILKTDGRLIVGLGTENVLETGITLHHTYGMPILPGSALKGLTAHYCDQVWGQRDQSNPSDTAVKFRGPRPKNNRPAEPQGDFHRLLFGSTDDSGCVIFHDAWFVPGSESDPLKLDVMTPHHPKWLDGLVPPSDFDSPTPVPFLAVAGKFHLTVSWHGPTTDKSTSWLNMAMDCLRQALFRWGIGGKTSSGYGRFNEDEWNTEHNRQQQQAAAQRQQAERQTALAQMRPIDRNMAEFLENHPNKAETREWLKLYEELRKPNSRWTSKEDRREVARRIRTDMQNSRVWDREQQRDRQQFIQQLLDGE